MPHPWLGTVHAARPDGKPSCSRCEIIATDTGSTLWRIDLVTGRPHQIRIHLASIGAPLLGDPLFLPGGHPRPDALPGDCLVKPPSSASRRLLGFLAGRGRPVLSLDCFF